MTEVPEHLLKRSAARRAALAGRGAEPAPPAAAAAPSAAARDVAPGARAVSPRAQDRAPLPTLDTEPAASEPDRPVVAAARSRTRIPSWAIALIAALPLWAVIYVNAVQPPPAGEHDPLVLGERLYVSAQCSGCHGASGAGGVGQKLNGGHVLATFDDPRAMAHWIAYGAAEGARPDRTYGDKDRPGGPMNLDLKPASEMRAYKDALTPEELAAVVIYVREKLSGGKPEDDPELNSKTFVADPAGTAAQVQAILDAGPGGDPVVDEAPAPHG